MKRLLIISMLILALLAPTFAIANVELQKIEGYLSSTMEKDKFTVNCEKDEQTFRFDWNKDSDFWVKVYGMTGKLLGDFQLSEGEDIILTGGGKFTLNVYSEDGSGEWSVMPIETEKKDK